jgi:hypothetical protein
LQAMSAWQPLKLAGDTKPLFTIAGC